MKKKTKKRLRLLLSLILVGVFAGLWFQSGKVQAPKMNWRVPVHIVAPEMPELPTMEQATDALDEIKDQVLPFEEKMVPEPTPVEPTPPVVAEPPPPPEVRADGKPRIALVIDDVGLASGLSRRAVRLPAFVTLSYLPYAQRLQEQANEAKEAGHEVMLHLPMQPMGKENPGPGALRVDQSEEDWQRLTMAALSSFEGFTGVNNHMGSRFTIDERGMNLVADALQEEGLFFLDSRTHPRSIAEGIMRQKGVKTVSRDVFIDDTQTLAAIRGELTRLEQTARRKGQAIAIGHPHLVTLQALESWIPEAQARGILFVPVSELVK